MTDKNNDDDFILWAWHRSSVTTPDEIDKLYKAFCEELSLFQKMRYYLAKIYNKLFKRKHMKINGGSKFMKFDGSFALDY